MLTLALDSETELIEPGTLAPRLVCISATTDGRNAELYKYHDASPIVAEALDHARNKRLRIVGQNISYDLAVFAAHDESLLPPIFDALDALAIEDTMINEKLLDLAQGRLKWHYDAEGNAVEVGYGLDAMCQRRGLTDGLDKGADGWRLRYGELREVPLDQWPERARVYPLDDARYTFRLDELQQIDAERLHNAGLDRPLYDAPTQCRQAFALHLMACWGMITEAEAVQRLEASLQGRQNSARAIIHAAGLLKTTGVRVQKTSKDMAAIRARVVAALGQLAPTTEKGQIKTDALTLKTTRDPGLLGLVDFNETEKLLSTYVTKLWAAVDTPLQPRVNSLLETGRVSMTDNFQTPPRAPGVRDCFVPRPGFRFCSVDFDGAELRTLAQACLNITGRSTLADLFRGDKHADPHTMFAGDMLGISREEALARKKAKDAQIKDVRQKAKTAIFAFPGGMGVDRFIATKAKEGLFFTQEEGRALKAQWHAFMPEMYDYFAHITNVIGYSTGTFRTFYSLRWRGGCGFCDGANNYFQAPVADGAKDAAYQVVKRMYVVRSSALYGSRLVNFLHDELLAEVPIEAEHEAGHEMAEVMIASLQRHTPDVPITASPALMKRWLKGAEPVYVNGRLVPWEPKP